MIEKRKININTYDESQFEEFVKEKQFNITS